MTTSRILNSGLLISALVGGVLAPQLSHAGEVTVRNCNDSRANLSCEAFGLNDDFRFVPSSSVQVSWRQSETLTCPGVGGCTLRCWGLFPLLDSHGDARVRADGDLIVGLTADTSCDEDPYADAPIFDYTQTVVGNFNTEDGAQSMLIGRTDGHPHWRTLLPYGHLLESAIVIHTEGTEFDAGDGVAVGDFDGDGFDEVATRRRNASYWEIGHYGYLENAAVPTRIEDSFVYLPTPFPFLEAPRPVVGDFDGDGIDDIAWFNGFEPGGAGFGGTNIRINSINGSWSLPLRNAGDSAQALNDWRSGWVLAGDYNGDGADDLWRVSDGHVYAYGDTPIERTQIRNYWKPGQYINNDFGAVDSSAPVAPWGPEHQLAGKWWAFERVPGTSYFTIQSIYEPSARLHNEFGDVEASEIWEGAHSSHWELIPVEGLSNTYRVRNRYRGTFLNIESGSLTDSPIHPGAHSNYWVLDEGFDLSVL